jgi:hypothetical protein
MRSARSRLKPRLVLAAVAILALTGAGADNFDVRTQIGPRPVLPEPNQYLLPPMHLATVVGWKAGETPKVGFGPAHPSPCDRPGASTICLHAAKRRRAGCGVAQP